MNRKRGYKSQQSNLNVWAAYTDLMSNAFLVLMLFSFMLMLSIRSIVAQDELDPVERVQTVEQVRNELIRTQEELLSTTEKNVSLSNENDSLRKKNEDSKLPVYEFPEANGYIFDTGSAEAPATLRQQIQTETAKEIGRLANDKGIDTIEVVGHTDGEAISGYSGTLEINLSTTLDSCLQNWPNSEQSCKPLSNTDLGMLRALSVVSLLQDIQKGGGLPEKLKFRAYSAGQLISPDEKGILPAGKENDKTRRRIEIRLAPRTFSAQE